MHKSLLLSLTALIAVALMFAAQSSAQQKEAEAQVGQPAPAFALEDQNGKTHSLSDYSGKIVVLEWFNEECPYVVRHHKEKEDTMRKLASKYEDKDVVWLAVNTTAGKSNSDNEQIAQRWDIEYPILNDSNGKVGKAYGAKTTPHMFIIDKEGKLAYAGGIDDDQQGSKSKDQRTNYVDKALTQLLAGETVAHAESRPYGCSIKFAR
jgi:peroxiredoxin